MIGLRGDGVIAQEVFEQLSHEVDTILVGERLSSHTGDSSVSEPEDG